MLSISLLQGASSPLKFQDKLVFRMRHYFFWLPDYIHHKMTSIILCRANRDWSQFVVQPGYWAQVLGRTTNSRSVVQKQSNHRFLYSLCCGPFPSSPFWVTNDGPFSNNVSLRKIYLMKQQTWLTNHPFTPVSQSARLLFGFFQLSLSMSCCNLHKGI
jgi:hypothetical protein